MKPTERVFDILLVEDNPADAKLIKIAFDECPDAKTNIRVLSDSKDAILYLYGEGDYAGAQLPDLIVLDYHMPTNGGLALAEIKGNPDFQQIPVVVITGSNNPYDVSDIYRRHANCCFQKPAKLEALFEMICAIVRHWLKRAMLPPKNLERRAHLGR